MKTSTSHTTGTCSGSMVVIGVLLTPVLEAVSLLCSVDPAYAHKKNVTGMGSLPIKTPVRNIVIFPRYVPGHARPLGDWRCKRCSSEKFVVRAENRICGYCGESSFYEPESAILHAASPGFRGFNDHSGKRVTHFKNWVARLQGNERCAITSDQIEAIKTRVFTYPDSLSEYKRIRLAMKELGLQKYYNNAYYVMKHCFGNALVRFSKLNEARLLAMFLRIQEPFARITKSRTNMLSYQFLIKKFCELLGYRVAEYIPHLKSRNNLQQQDFIWKQICDELGLPFYASV